ncbi:MAG: preprotein translocase subunit SecY, partial [Planctomycetales bacterium]|nr:preprotein translocase subunit SecY [Planctomycetales bacterium]
MWEKIRVVFTIPELRQKILLTLLFLAIYRVGWHISLPMIDQAANAAAMKAQEGQGGFGFGKMAEYAAVFSASNLRQATIFGLGIMPYISASIIFQLLGSVWKPIEELQKEGEAGRKKINEYTRYLTVVLCLVQSLAYVRMYVMAVDPGSGLPVRLNPNFIADGATNMGLFWQVTAVLTMTCGTIFLMWLGEQIDEYGIGNGISLLIMAGIL